jgi:hypothetical protein
MAYGSIPAPPIPTSSLPILSYNLPSQKTLTTFPLTLDSCPDDLRKLMSEIFTAEVESELLDPITFISSSSGRS